MRDVSPVVDAVDRLKNPGEVRGYDRQTIYLIAVMVFALVLRWYHLGQSSLWYDEVVTMKLARTENPAALCRQLR